MPPGFFLPPSLLDPVSGGQETFCSVDNWTLVQEWDTAIGDMTAIDADMSFKSCNGFYWSPDGTVFVISNPGDGTVYCWSASTPFDPDTLSTLSNTGSAIPVPGEIKAVAANRFWTLYGPGAAGNIREYNMSGYSIGATTTLQGELTKATMGYTDSTDPHYTAKFGGSIIYTVGDNDEELKYFGGVGDLDNITGPDDSSGPSSVWSSAGRKTSLVSNDGLSWYEISSGFASKIYLTAVGDTSTVAREPVTDPGRNIRSELSMGFQPQNIYINPNDTEFVWVANNSSAQFELAKLAMNCPA